MKKYIQVYPIKYLEQSTTHVVMQPLYKEIGNTEYYSEHYVNEEFHQQLPNANMQFVHYQFSVPVCPYSIA